MTKSIEKYLSKIGHLVDIGPGCDCPSTYQGHACFREEGHEGLHVDISLEFEGIEAAWTTEQAEEDKANKYAPKELTPYELLEEVLPRAIREVEWKGVYPLDSRCCQSRFGQWLCTRPPGHMGKHVALVGTHVCDIWDDRNANKGKEGDDY